MSKHSALFSGVIAGVAGLIAGDQVYAQNNVTLYGVVDAGLLYTTRSGHASGHGQAHDMGNQFSVIDAGSSSSEFGIKGTEDLGGGLKVAFKLESGISVANGGFHNSNGNLFGRQAWVALDGSFGQFKAGLQFSPFFVSLYELDPRGLSQFGSSLIPYLDSVAATGIFNSNALSWSSPEFAGFEGSLMYAPGGTPGDIHAGRQYSARLKYAHGPLMLVASIYDGSGNGTFRTPVPTTVEFAGRMAGASYRFGNLTAKASYAKYRVAGGFSNDVFGGGLDYLMLPQLNINGGIWYTIDRHRPGNHSIMAAVGTSYFVSKRTTLYAQVGVVDNDGQMNTGLAVSNALIGFDGFTAGATVGVRHTF